MSGSREGIREREALEALQAGGFYLPSAMYKAQDDAFRRANEVGMHVAYEMDHGREREDRTMAGLAILERLVAVIDKAVSEMQAATKDFSDALQPFMPQGGDDDYEMPVPDEERHVRDLIKGHRIPPRFGRLTLPELIGMYAPTLGGDDGEH